MHGAEIKEEQPVSQSGETQPPSSEVPLFGDPEQYDKLSAEDKESLTDKMLSKHKNWANKTMGIKNG